MYIFIVIGIALAVGAGYYAVKGMLKPRAAPNVTAPVTTPAK
jgi:hypothetical protein